MDETERGNEGGATTMTIAIGGGTLSVTDDMVTVIGTVTEIAETGTAIETDGREIGETGTETEIHVEEIAPDPDERETQFTSTSTNKS